MCYSRFFSNKHSAIYSKIIVGLWHWFSTNCFGFQNHCKSVYTISFVELLLRFHAKFGFFIEFAFFFKEYKDWRRSLPNLDNRQAFFAALMFTAWIFLSYQGNMKVFVIKKVFCYKGFNSYFFGRGKQKVSYFYSLQIYFISLKRMLMNEKWVDFPANSFVQDIKWWNIQLKYCI